ERRRVEQERAEHLAREQALRTRAEEAGVLKDQFLATLSHELRTPLTAILGYARLLRDGTLPAAAAGRALDVIERNARAQVQLFNDLLDVSSIMLGELRLGQQSIPLPTVVEAELEAVRGDAERGRLTLEYEAAEPLPPVTGDVGRLQQIIRNLLSNAIKFTPAGRGRGPARAGRGRQSPRSSRGSSTSRSQSPTRLMPSTSSRIARPGKSASHQPVVM